MTRVTARAALLAALSVASQAPSPSAPAKTVDVHAWVENNNGLPASSISPADFELLVDGALVKIEQIAPRAHGTSLIVLIDTSRSVSWDREVLERHIGEFAGELGAADRLSIATFGARTTLPPFQVARRDVRAELRLALERRDQEGYGSSPVWDAMYEAVTVLAREPGARAILLLTDGRTTGNRYGISQVADYAMMHGVCISAVLKHSSQMISQAEGNAVIVQPGTPMRGLTSFTGGMLFTYPESQDDQARAVFKRVASTLTATHVFSFAPPQFDGLPHRLVIRPVRQYVHVYAPVGFIAR